jgi:hypothetical protein
MLDQFESRGFGIGPQISFRALGSEADVRHARVERHSLTLSDFAAFSNSGELPNSVCDPAARC